MRAKGVFERFVAESETGSFAGRHIVCGRFTWAAPLDASEIKHLLAIGHIVLMKCGAYRIL